MADSNFDIWRMQAQGDVRGLITLLRHASPEIRRRAATALRTFGATVAIPALQIALVTEGDAAVRAVLVSALEDLFKQTVEGDNKPAVDRQRKVVNWIAQLSSANAEHIIRAAQNLADLNEKMAAEALVLVFRNPQHSGHIRLAAAEALLKLESAPVEVTLLAALRNPDWRTRRNAAGVLGQLHADWAVEPLAATLHDPQEAVRRTAYAALKRIDTPEARRATEMSPSLAVKLATATSEQPVVRLQPESTTEAEVKAPEPDVEVKPTTPEPEKSSEALPLAEVPVTEKPPLAEAKAAQPEAEVKTRNPEAEKTPEIKSAVEVPIVVETQPPAATPSEATATPLPPEAKTPQTEVDSKPSTPDTLEDAKPPQAETETKSPAPNAEPDKVSEVTQNPTPAQEVSASLPIPTSAPTVESTLPDEDTQPIAPIVDEDVS